MANAAATNRTSMIMSQRMNATEKQYIRQIQQVNRETNQKLARINRNLYELKEMMEKIKICNSDKDPSAIRLLGSKSRRLTFDLADLPNQETDSVTKSQRSVSIVPLQVVTETIVPNPLEVVSAAPSMPLPTHPVTNILPGSPNHSRKHSRFLRRKTPIGTRITRFLDHLDSDKKCNDLVVVDASDTMEFRSSRTLTQTQWNERILRWNPLMANNNDSEEYDNDLGDCDKM